MLIDFFVIMKMMQVFFVIKVVSGCIDGWMDGWMEFIFNIYNYVSLYFMIYIIKIFSLYNVGVLVEECYDGNCRGLLEVFLDNIVCGWV